jgi:prophage DNA circulation protein
LRRASYRGAPFHVEQAAGIGGRRDAVFEFAKRDDPYTEDMGRRARRVVITGYVLGDDYEAQRTELIRALEAEGAGMLVHPSWGSLRANCNGFTVIENRQKGGMATFEMNFVEAGVLSLPVATDTAAVVRKGADAAAAAAAAVLDGVNT